MANNVGEGIAAANAGGGGGFPPFDVTTYPSQLIWLALVFGGFYYLMTKIALPRVAGILETRHDRVASDQDEASRLHNEAEEVLADYDKAIESAHQSAHELAVKSKSCVTKKVAKIREDGEKKLTKKVNQAEAKINGAAQKAMEELAILDITHDIARQFIADVSRNEVESAVALAHSAKGLSR